MWYLWQCKALPVVGFGPDFIPVCKGTCGNTTCRSCKDYCLHNFYSCSPTKTWGAPPCENITDPEVMMQRNTHGQVFTHWQWKDELFISFHCCITSSHLAKSFVTTGQLSSPSDGLRNMVCNLIVVTVQCTGKESSHHRRHLCICYELVFLEAVPHEESRASPKQEYLSPYIIRQGMEPTGRAEGLHLPWRCLGRGFFHDLVLPR